MIALETNILAHARRAGAHLGAMRQALVSGRATGNLVHDAHIAAVLLEHGVHEVWTADRDFARFPGLKVHDPFH